MKVAIIGSRSLTNVEISKFIPENMVVFSSNSWVVRVI